MGGEVNYDYVLRYADFEPTKNEFSFVFRRQRTRMRICDK
jgi:hypothetical protein